MKTRAITAFFFTIVMLGSILFGVYTFSIFYLLLSVLALSEFYSMIELGGAKPNRIAGILLSLGIFSICIGGYLNLLDWKSLVVILPLSFLVFIWELYRKENSPFTNIGYTLLGSIYVTVPFCLFYGLGFIGIADDYNFHLPLAFLLMLWGNDTGAYLFGMKLGKRKLFERHSPKKSWEGFFGGVFTSALVAVLISYQFTEVGVAVWVGMGLLIASFGTLGDLVESMLKRSLDVKDSGTLLPGHGGFLDRFDGLLLAAPMVYVYFYLLDAFC